MIKNENKIVNIADYKNIIIHHEKKNPSWGGLWMFVPMLFLPVGICAAVLFYYGVMPDIFSIVIFNLIQSLIIGFYGLYRFYKYIDEDK